MLDTLIGLFWERNHVPFIVKEKPPAFHLHQPSCNVIPICMSNLLQCIKIKRTMCAYDQTSWPMLNASTNMSCNAQDIHQHARTVLFAKVFVWQGIMQ